MAIVWSHSTAPRPTGQRIPLVGLAVEWVFSHSTPRAESVQFSVTFRGCDAVICGRD